MNLCADTEGAHYEEKTNYAESALRSSLLHPPTPRVQNEIDESLDHFIETNTVETGEKNAFQR